MGAKTSSARPKHLLPTFAAISIFMLGFVPMSLFALLGSWDETKRDFWSYRSATLGDALLLPLLAFVLCSEIATGRWAMRDKIVVGAAGLLGLVSGAVPTVLVLSGFDKGTNWTQPDPGRIIAPGWYHSSFTVLAFSSLTMATAAAVISARKRKPAASTAQLRLLRSRLLGFSIVTFTSILALDNHQNGSPVTVATVWMPLAGLIVAVAYQGVVVPDIPMHLATLNVASAVLPASMLAIITSQQFTDIWAIAVIWIAATLAAIVGYFTPKAEGSANYEIATRSFVSVSVLLTVAGSLEFSLGGESRSLARALIGGTVLIGALTTIVVASRKLSVRPDHWPARFAWQATAALLILIELLLWWSDASEFATSVWFQTLASLFFAGVASVLTVRSIDQLIRRVQEVERSEEASKYETLIATKLQSFLPLSALTGLGFLSILASFLVGQRTSEGPSETVVGAPMPAWVFWMLITYFLCASAIHWELNRRDRNSLLVIVATQVGGSALLVGALINSEHRFGFVSLALLIWVGVLPGLFLAESIIGHARMLSGRSLNRLRRLVAALQAMLWLLASYLVLQVALSNPILSLSFAMAMGLVVAIAMLFCASVAFGSSSDLLAGHPAPHRARLSEGTFQDSIMVVLMVVLGLVAIEVAHARGAQVVIPVLSTIVGGWAISAVFSSLRANVAHVRDQDALPPESRTTLATEPSELARHIWRQNSITLAYVLPLTLAMILIDQFKAEGFGLRVAVKTIRRYIPSFNSGSAGRRADVETTPT